MSEQEQDATEDDRAAEQRSARMRAAIREIPTDLPMSDITEAIEAAVDDRARLVAGARERALVSQVNMYQADSFTAQAEHARWQERAAAAEAALANIAGMVEAWDWIPERGDVLREIDRILSPAMEQTPEPDLPNGHAPVDQLPPFLARRVTLPTGGNTDV